MYQSLGSVGFVGRVEAIDAQESPLDQTRTRRRRSSGRIDLPLCVGGAWMHFDGWRRLTDAEGCAEAAVVAITVKAARPAVHNMCRDGTPLGTVLA